MTSAAAQHSESLDWDAILDARHASSSQPVVAGAISFAVSRPSEELFPMDDFRASCEEVMAGPDFGTVLQLGSPGGYEPLRQPSYNRTLRRRRNGSGQRVDRG